MGDVPDHQARMLARAEDLGRVLDALRASEEGSGRLVLLAGEPGVGKTRLAQEASVRARERLFTVAAGRCYEAHTRVPFYPFLDALSTLYEKASPEIRGAIPEHYPYLVRLLPDHFPSRSAVIGESQEESQRLLRAVTGFVREVANAELTRCRALLSLQRPEEAFEVLEEAMPLAEEANALGDSVEVMPPAERANFLRNLADGMLVFDVLYSARGDFDRSLEWAERALALARRLDNQKMIASCTGRIGLYMFYWGEWKEARAYFEQGVEIDRSLGRSFYSARLPCYLGRLCLAEGSWEEAGHLLEEAIAMAKDVQWPVVLYSSQILRAELDLAKGHPQAALERLEPLVDTPDLNWTNITPPSDGSGAGPPGPR